MTATATIQVAYVNPPEGNRKKGSIKSTDGTLYSVWPNQIGLFRQGDSYEVDYEERPYNGRTYLNVSHVRPLKRPQAVPQAAAPGNSEPAPRSIPISEDREFEFVTRVLCARVSIGGMTPKDLVDGGVMLRQAYAAIFGTGARA